MSSIVIAKKYAVFCRFPEGKLDFAKQNRPILDAFLLSLKLFKKKFRGMDGKWWSGIYRGGKVTRRQILYR